MIEGIQRSLRQKMRELKMGGKSIPETGSSDSGSDNKTFMGKLEENSDDEDLFDDIPPFVPDATQGKLLIDPDAGRSPCREFVWMLVAEQYQVRTSDHGRNAYNLYSDIFKFGLLWRLSLTAAEEEGGDVLLSLQLAQSSVDFVANLQVQTELFIPGAEMRNGSSSVKCVSFSPHSHGARPLITISSDLFEESDKSISIRVVLKPAALATTSLDDDFEKHYDCLKMPSY